jgi:hypothetical protein
VTARVTRADIQAAREEFLASPTYEAVIEAWGGDDLLDEDLDDREHDADDALYDARREAVAR